MSYGRISSSSSLGAAFRRRRRFLTRSLLCTAALLQLVCAPWQAEGPIFRRVAPALAFSNAPQHQSTSAPPATRNGVQMDTLGGLRPWLKQHGGRVSEALCLAGLGSASSARGLCVDKNVPEGDVLLAVPSHLWLSAAALLPPDLLQRTSAEPWDVRLAVGLATLLDGTRPPPQELVPYLAMLPAMAELESQLPLLWNETALRAEEWAPWLEEYVGYRRERLERVRTESVWSGLNVSWQELRRAHALTLSRNLGDDDTSLIVPVVDFANHAPEGSGGLSRANCRLAHVGPNGEVDPTDTKMGSLCIGLVATKPLKFGDEVLFEYGPYSNPELFLDYGFTLEDNPYDERKEEPALELFGLSVPSLFACVCQGAELPGHV